VRYRPRLSGNQVRPDQTPARSVMGMPPAEADIYPTEQQVSSLVRRTGWRMREQAAGSAVIIGWHGKSR